MLPKRSQSSYAHQARGLDYLRSRRTNTSSDLGCLAYALRKFIEKMYHIVSLLQGSSFNGFQARLGCIPPCWPTARKQPSKVEVEFLFFSPPLLSFCGEVLPFCISY